MRRGFLLTVLGLGGLVVGVSILISLRNGTRMPAQSESPAAGGESELAEAPLPRETNFPAPAELPPNPQLAIAPAQKKVSATEDSAIDVHDAQHEARLAARVA